MFTGHSVLGISYCCSICHCACHCLTDTLTKHSHHFVLFCHLLFSLIPHSLFGSPLLLDVCAFVHEFVMCLTVVALFLLLMSVFLFCLLGISILFLCYGTVLLDVLFVVLQLLTFLYFGFIIFSCF
jgi:hypothetical protein